MTRLDQNVSHLALAQAAGGSPPPCDRCPFASHCRASRPMLRGARAIGEYLWPGDPAATRRVFYLVEHGRLAYARIGNTICAYPDVLDRWLLVAMENNAGCKLPRLMSAEAHDPTDEHSGFNNRHCVEK